ncbi:hypothetical protein PHYBOEH_006660, partial [Phytophthora boehmeriae]
AEREQMRHSRRWRHERGQDNDDEDEEDEEDFDTTEQHQVQGRVTMAKITNFMRVTKAPKAHSKQEGKKVVDSHAVKRQRAKKEVSTPSKKEKDEESEEFIPTFIYETVKYEHKRTPHRVSKELKTVVEYINKYYDVPSTFERDAKFGTHSGLTFEKRLARAYSLGQLPLKRQGRGNKTVATPAPICLTCAVVGHSYKYCPDGF